MRRFYSIVFLLMAPMLVPVFGSTPTDSARRAGMSLPDLYRAAAKHVLANNIDSALAYFDVVTRQYDEHNVAGLKQTERNIVTRSYYFEAFFSVYYKFDNLKAIRYLLTGLKTCNNEAERYNLLTVRNLLMQQYAILIPTDENRQTALQFLEESFRIGLKLAISPSNSGSDYLNLFMFGIGDKERKQFRWATDSVRRLHFDADDIKQGFTLQFCQAIEHLDNRQPQLALDDFRYIKDKLLPAFSDYSYHDIVFSNMADLFKQQGQRDSFLYYTQRCVQTGIEGDNPYALLLAYKELAEYYQQAGDTATAKQYQVQYMQKRDSLFINGGFEQIFKSGIIQQFSTDKEPPASQPVRWWPYALAGVLLVLLAVALLLWHRRKAKPSADDMLQTEDAGETTVEMAKYQNSPLSEERKDMLYVRILEIMCDFDIVSNPDFSITMLAERCHANQKYVSQVINERTGLNFKSLLATYRIEEVCRRMKDPRYVHLTLEAIAQGVGYRSRFSFINAFKRIKGMSPSEYTGEQDV